jgi:exodeoxyribonuclease VII large subunit
LALPTLLATRRAALVKAERALPDAPALLRGAASALADRGARLRLGLPALLAGTHHRLATAAAGLPAALRHAVQRQRIVGARTLLQTGDGALLGRLREAAARVEGLGARLASADPRAVLARGYALVTDTAGRPVTSAAAVRPAARLKLEFGDGTVDVQRVADPASKRQRELSF